MTMADSRARRAGALMAAMVVLAVPAANALDAGHHFDLTSVAMREQGFGETAIGVAQVANWLTDYYSTSPTSRDKVQTELSKLHFDNLWSTGDVARYWSRLVANTREATRRAAQADDPLVMLTVVGLSLHAVQDFYAHSNWVETHPRATDAAYRRETWLADGPPTGSSLFTGSYPPYPSPPPRQHPEHGGYDTGLNKDSHVRPMFPEAYVFAYCATHELLRAIGAWAEQSRNGFWTRVKEYRIGEKLGIDLEADLEAARNLSMYVKGKGAEGHWKGGESGSARYLSRFALEWTSRPASVFVKQVKKHRVHEWLTEGLYSDETPPPVPEIAPFRGERAVIEIGTTYVAEVRGGGRRIDRGRKADLYAVTTVEGQPYRDRVLRNRKRYVEPWLTLHLAEADTTEVPIRYEVWDQDETLGRHDDLCDANPRAGERALSFAVRLRDGQLEGEVTGRYTSPERPVEISGGAPDTMAVLIRFYVRTRALSTP